MYLCTCNCVFVCLCMSMCVYVCVYVRVQLYVSVLFGRRSLRTIKKVWIFGRKETTLTIWSSLVLGIADLMGLAFLYFFLSLSFYSEWKSMKQRHTRSVIYTIPKKREKKQKKKTKKKQTNKTKQKNKQTNNKKRISICYILFLFFLFRFIYSC